LILQKGKTTTTVKPPLTGLSTGVQPKLDGSEQARPPLLQKSHHSTKKSVNFDHEIMEIGIICSNLIEKSHPPSPHTRP
jgi:hypothetical protein